MRLVTSMMTTKEMSDSDITDAAKIIQNMFKYKQEIQKYKYDDRQYYEVDIDLLDVSFSKETLCNEIDKLISAYEGIIKAMPQEIDIIVANDDTETEITRYENDKNDIKDFGLFVTKREIPDINPYYTSQYCNAYVNLMHVSFGVYY